MGELQDGGIARWGSYWVCESTSEGLAGWGLAGWQSGGLAGLKTDSRLTRPIALGTLVPLG